MYNSPEQKKAAEKALETPIKAVAFDVDGTLTPFCRFNIPNTLIQTLNQIPIHIPLAICTGRPVEYIHGKLDSICRNFTDQRRRWYVIAENGGAGYKYNEKTAEYDCFYEAKWPNEIITKDRLEILMKHGLGRRVPRIHKRDFSVVVIYIKWFYYSFFVVPKVIQSRSARMVKRIRNFMQKTEENGKLLSDHFKVLDSGLGSLIIPQKNGKGAAVRAWSKELNIPLENIVCIGDRPDPGGNDEDMMTGESGLAFTVGRRTKNTYPLPVFGAHGKQLIGPEGTETIIERLNFDS